MKKSRAMENKITNEATMDKISKLPEPIIHDIMSLLSIKDLTSFGSVSNRFFSAYHSSPTIHFDFESFSSKHKSITSSNILKSVFLAPVVRLFLAYVARSLARRRSLVNDNTNTSSTCDFQRLSFVGPISDDNSFSVKNLVNDMVSFADDNKIKELNLDVKSDDNIIRCELPNKVFSFNHITSLKIRGFQMESQSLILCCPSIREFCLCECNKLGLITLGGAELKHVVLDTCGGLKKVDIDPRVSLESFSYMGSSYERQTCEINLHNQSKSLKYLQFKGARMMTDEWFRDNVSPCKLLETLKLEQCHFLNRFYIKSDYLKTLELEYCDILVNVDIMAPNLETFLLVCPPFQPQCKINISNSVNLKHLKLNRNAEVTDQWVKDNLSLFPFLEVLELEKCSLSKIVIHDKQYLRSLKLLVCRDLGEVEINNAPNLVSFIYKGHVLPNSSIKLDSSCLLDAQLIFLGLPAYINYNYHQVFRDFIGSFNHCNTLSIYCASEVVIFPQSIRDSMIAPLYDLKHLKVQVTTLMKDYSTVELIEALLWLVPHPETVSLTSTNSHIMKSLKFRYNPAVKVEDELCCGIGSIKCWRHFVESVEMENFEDSYEKTSVENFLIENAKTSVNVICV